MGGRGPGVQSLRPHLVRRAWRLQGQASARRGSGGDAHGEGATPSRGTAGRQCPLLSAPEHGQAGRWQAGEGQPQHAATCRSAEGTQCPRQLCASAPWRVALMCVSSSSKLW